MTRRKHRRLSPPFFKWTDGLGEVDCLVLASLDRQQRIAVDQIPTQLLEAARQGKKQGEKLTVAAIHCTPKGQGGNFIVTLKDGGEQVAFWGKRDGGTVTSGSTGNALIDLRQLLPNRLVGGVGAVGVGKDGQVDADGVELLRDLEQWGIEYGVIPANLTSFSVRLRERGTGRILLLCKKGRHVLSTGIGEYVAELIRPRTVAFTSLRPSDFSFAEDTVRRLRQGHRRSNQPFVALVPHPNLIDPAQHHLRPQVVALIRELDLLVMNAHEAGLLIGGTFVPERIGEVAKLGAAITIVTLDKEGAVVAYAGGTFHQRPIAERTKVVEPTGAGDSFLATILARQMERPIGSWDRLVTVIRDAVFVSGHKVGNQGPWTIPTPERIRRFHGRQRR